MSLKVVDINSNFVIENPELGRGDDSVAMLVSDRNRIQYALKVSNISRLADEIKEYRILNKLSACKDIVKVYDIFMDGENHPCLLLEYLGNTSLESYIYSSIYTENIMYLIIGHIMNSMKCMHDLNIVHLDLHVQNIAVTPNGSIKIYDFGESCELYSEFQCSRNLITKRFSGYNNVSIEEIGTIPPDYISFENGSIQSYEYLKSVDIYAFGNMMKIMVYPLNNVAPIISDLIARCTDESYLNRPNINQLIQLYTHFIIELYPY